MEASSPREPQPALVRGATGDWEIIVGLEVHAQVSSKAKLFSCASTEFGAPPNSNVDFVDAAMPGMLPVVNEFCLEQAVKTGLGLKAEINRNTAFDRKNYFYPDLPQGYQISQLYSPIVGRGEVIVELDDGAVRKVRIDHIHLEQDAGKSLHDIDATNSFVDLNRTGVALMEIVSFPDIRGPKEAAAYILKLRQIMRYLGTCDGNMQNGNLRADVNVSVRRAGSDDFGTRCEIKNMNSTRFIQRAIQCEADRQVGILENGGEVIQETRLYDPASGKTRSMRSKEEAHDYRYFPCPDLLPLELEEGWIQKIASGIPELPDEKKARFVSEYGVTPHDAGVLTASADLADFFEEVAHGRDGKLVANWIVNELVGRLTSMFGVFKPFNIDGKRFGKIIDLISSGDISGTIAKELLDIVLQSSDDPVEIVNQRGLRQFSDTAVIEAEVDKQIAAHPEQAKKVRTNPKVAGFFVGQVMKATGGKANPRVVNETVRKRLLEQN